VVPLFVKVARGTEVEGRAGEARAWMT